MDKTALIIAAYGLAAAAANFLGGFLVASRRLGQVALRYLIALGAGFMLAAVFIKLIPESLEQWRGEKVLPMLWVLAGYMLIQFVEHTLAPHFHFGEETHEEAMLRHHAALAVGMATFIGVALVLAFRHVAVASLPLSAHVLPLSAGVTLYVAASDLIPEVNKEPGVRIALVVFIGVGLLALLRYYFH